MSATDYGKSLARVLVYEGGKVDDPQDPGGRTNQGVTQRSYNAWRRSMETDVRDVYLMTSEERNAIYKKAYWDVVRGDALPIGVDFALFDAAVNSGSGQAVKWLQAALGDSYEDQHDGVIGDKTLQAVQDFGDLGGLVEAICSRRLATLQRLHTWSRYGKGWHARIANVQKTALSWIESAPTPSAVNVADLNGNAKAPVSGNLKDPIVSQMATHVTTAASSAGTVVAQATTGLTPYADSFAWMKYALGGLAISSVVAGVFVKIALDAKDAAAKGIATSTVDLSADEDLQTVKEDANVIALSPGLPIPPIMPAK